MSQTIPKTVMSPPESFLGPEDAEHDVVFHHIEVPGDYGAFVRVLNEDLVNLKYQKLISKIKQTAIQIFTISMILIAS